MTLDHLKFATRMQNTINSRGGSPAKLQRFTSVRDPNNLTGPRIDAVTQEWDVVALAQLGAIDQVSGTLVGLEGRTQVSLMLTDNIADLTISTSGFAIVVNGQTYAIDDISAKDPAKGLVIMTVTERSDLPVL